MPQACFHECPRCGRPWEHSVPWNASLDAYFTWCSECLRRVGFDFVAAEIRRERRRCQVADDEGPDEFRVVTPVKEKTGEEEE